MTTTITAPSDIRLDLSDLRHIGEGVEQVMESIRGMFGIHTLAATFTYSPAVVGGTDLLVTVAAEGSRDPEVTIRLDPHATGGTR